MSTLRKPVAKETSSAVASAASQATSACPLRRSPRRQWALRVLALALLPLLLGRTERAGAAPACPADCDGNGSVSGPELAAALSDVLTPSSNGLPTRCPAVDADQDGSYGVEDLIRGATASGLGCTLVVAPAGWRGAVTDGRTGALLTGVTVSANPWPLPFPAAQDPEKWMWPARGSSTPSPTPERRVSAEVGSPPLMRPGLPPPLLAFDPPAAACLPGTSSTPPPTPGWQRLRVEKPGYATRVFYQPVEFKEREMSFTTAACNEGSVRDAASATWSLYAQGMSPSEGLLPDIIVDERWLRRDLTHVCVDMPESYMDLRALRLSLGTPNVGLGDLRLEGVNVGDCDASNDVVEQWIALDPAESAFRRRRLPAGSLEPHPAHGHFHLRDWARFRLVRPTPGLCDDPKSRPRSCVARESDKLSFCIMDSDGFDYEIGPSNRRFSTCNIQGDGVVRMGIQRGWSDVYGLELFGQFIETTGRSGSYWLEAEANLSGAIEEADLANNWARIPVAFSTPQACVERDGAWQCAVRPPPTGTGTPTPGGCRELDCSNVSPDCCPCSGECSPDYDRTCWLCKDYFCLRDPSSVACLGPCGTCPVESQCPETFGGAVTPCASETPTRTPTAPTRTPTVTPTRTRTPTGATPTPTPTPPTPRIPGLAVLIPDLEGQPGQRVLLEIYLAGSAGLVGGLQFDLLVPQAALGALNLSPEASDCSLTGTFSSTHRLRAAYAPDRPLAGFDRVRFLVVDRNVTELPYDDTATLSDGVVVRCWFSILTNAQRGPYPLRIDRARAGDVRGTPLWPIPGRSTLWVGGCSGTCC